MERTPQRATYRLIVTRRNASEVLLLPSGSGWTLPRAEIERQSRLAQELTGEALRSWGISAYLLHGRTARSSAPTGTKNWAIMESAERNGRAPEGTYWMHRSIAATPCGEDSSTVREALAELDAFASGERAGAFARPGWLRDLFGWPPALLYACAKTVSGPSSSATCGVIPAAQTVSARLTSLSLPRSPV